MQRDMDLIRSILLEAERSEHGFIFKNPVISGYTEERVGYHVHLMKQAGLVDAIDLDHDEAPSPNALLSSLTWKGHEFIESARSPTVWNQARELMHRAGGGSFKIWQSVLTDIVKSSLGVG